MASSSIEQIYDAFGFYVPKAEYTTRFNNKTEIVLKDRGYISIYGSLLYEKDTTNPALLLCLYDQLLKDGFKQILFDKQFDVKEYFFGKPSLVDKIRSIARGHPIEKPIITDKTIYKFNHENYGELTITFTYEKEKHVFSSVRINISKDKYDIISPYLINLLTNRESEFVKCLYKHSPLAKADRDRIKAEREREKKRIRGIFTISDFDMYNEVFQDIKYRSTCPVCLTTQPKDPRSCRYTYHQCNPIDLKHPDQKKLYEIFNKDGLLTWCSSCNRICKNHGHFKKAKIADILAGTIPPLLPGEQNVFSVDCSPYGGGFTEKLIRYESLLRESVEIQKLGENITLADAKIRLVRALWDGPFLIQDDATIQHLKTKNQFTVSRYYFSIPGTEFLPKAEEKDISRPAEDSGLVPTKLEAPNNKCAVELGSPHEDNRPTWRFKHRKTDGTIFEHPDGDDICADDFMQALTGTMHDTIGKCPINPSVCDAKIHPDEVKHIIGTEDPRYRLYETFYKERAQAGGGEQVESVFPKGPEFESICPLPPKKTAGKKKTTKSRGKKRRTTYRKKNKNRK